MRKVDTFTFRINLDERQMLADLAARLERSQSDALRFLVRGAYAEMNSRPSPDQQPETIKPRTVKHASAQPCE